MALIACPDCGHKVSDAAPACIHCGRPLAALAPVTARDVAPPSAPGESRFVCRRCGSDDVRRLRLIYESGISTGQLETQSPGIDGVVARTRTVFGWGLGPVSEQSVLSKEVAPPELRTQSEARKWGASIAAIGFAIAILTRSMLVFVIGLILGGVTAAVLVMQNGDEINQYNLGEYPKLRAQWERSLMCMRCGAIVELERGAS